MGKRRRSGHTSDFWADVTRRERPGKGNPEIECRYCYHRWYSQSLTRLCEHMKVCRSLPNDLWERYDRGSCAPKRKRIQSTLSFEEHFIPEEERRVLDRLLAEAVYSSGIPFSFVSYLCTLPYKILTSVQVENPAFRRFLERVRPEYKPPHRKALATTLLNDVYAHTKQQMGCIIAEAKHLTLVSDSWTYQRSESITNYVVQTRTHAIFVGSEPTGAERHTKEVIARDTQRRIEELGGGGGGDGVVAVVTDHAANMRAAWPMLESQYSGLLTLGCASHTVNLLVEDILRVSQLESTLHSAVNAIRYFKSSNARTAELDKAARFLRVPRISLKLPVKTRWQGKYEAITSLIANKPYIQTVIADRTACLGTRVSGPDAAIWARLKVLLHEYRFWEQLDTLHRFLAPYLSVTLKLESDKPRGSRIYAYFNDLLTASVPAGLPRDEIIAIISKRWAQLQHPLFTVAFICDLTARDEYQDLNIPDSTKSKMADWLRERYGRPIAAQLMAELSAVFRGDGIYSNQTIRDSFAEYEDPAFWWLERECSDHLKALAIYALSVNPTTGAAERNWSVHSYVHSRARNRLTNERVQKLVYLFQNLRVRDRVETSTPSYFSDDEVEICSDDGLDGEEPINELQIELAVATPSL